MPSFGKPKKTMNPELLATNPAYEVSLSLQQQTDTKTSMEPDYEEADLPSNTYYEIATNPSAGHSVGQELGADEATYEVVDRPNEVTPTVINETEEAGTNPEEYNMLVHTGNQYTQIPAQDGYSKLRGGAKHHPNPDVDYNVLFQSEDQ